MGDILAEREKWPAGATAYFDRGAQRVDRRGKILRVEPGAGRAWHLAAAAAARGVWSLVGGKLLARGQRGTGFGPLRNAWLAWPAPPLLPDAVEPLVLRRMRQKFEVTRAGADERLEQLTTEQVRRAMNTWLEAALGRLSKAQQFQRELAKQRYYQRRNAQARRSHTKTRRARLQALGIDADRIKSCIPRSPT